MSAAATRASTRKNAVCTTQPKKLRPSKGLKNMPRPAQLSASPQLRPVKVLVWPIDLGAGSPRQVAAEEHQRGVGGRQVLADDRLRPELDVAAEGHRRRADACR